MIQNRLKSCILLCCLELEVLIQPDERGVVWHHGCLLLDRHNPSQAPSHLHPRSGWKLIVPEEDIILGMGEEFHAWDSVAWIWR